MTPLQREALQMCLEYIETDAHERRHVRWKINEALAAPAQQEPVVKPYAYEYGRNNGDGTYSVVIEKGDLVQTAPAVYNYVRPRNAHKDWPIKELFDHPPAQRTWVGLTDEERQACINYRAVEAKLKEKNT